MELTERQQLLYSYFLANAESGMYIDANRIAKDLPLHYPRQEEVEKNVGKYNSSALRNLRYDIEAINASSVAKVIVSNSSGGYKIATKEEAIEQMERLEKAARKKWKKCAAIRKKLMSNNQMAFNSSHNIIAIKSVIDNEKV